MDENILEKIHSKISAPQEIINLIHDKAKVYNEITKDLDYSVDWAIINCIEKYEEEEI